MVFSSQNIRNPGMSIALAIIVVVAGYLALPSISMQPAGVPYTLTSAEAMAQAALADPEFMIGDQRVDGAALFRFYRPRNERLVWSEGGKVNANAEMALRALTDAREHGLDGSNYHLEQLVYQPTFASHDDAAVYDLLLTDAVLSQARAIRAGRTTPQPFDAVSSLAYALETGRLAKFLGGS